MAKKGIDYLAQRSGTTWERYCSQRKIGSKYCEVVGQMVSNTDDSFRKSAFYEDFMAKATKKMAKNQTYEVDKILATKGFGLEYTPRGVKILYNPSASEIKEHPYLSPNEITLLSYFIDKTTTSKELIEQYDTNTKAIQEMEAVKNSILKQGREINTRKMSSGKFTKEELTDIENTESEAVKAKCDASIKEYLNLNEKLKLEIDKKVAEETAQAEALSQVAGQVRLNSNKEWSNFTSTFRGMFGDVSTGIVGDFDQPISATNKTKKYMATFNGGVFKKAVKKLEDLGFLKMTATRAGTIFEIKKNLAPKVSSVGYSNSSALYRLDYKNNNIQDLVGAVLKNRLTPDALYLGDDIRKKVRANGITIEKTVKGMKVSEFMKDAKVSNSKALENILTRLKGRGIVEDYHINLQQDILEVKLRE